MQILHDWRLDNLAVALWYVLGMDKIKREPREGASESIQGDTVQLYVPVPFSRPYDIMNITIDIDEECTLNSVDGA